MIRLLAILIAACVAAASNVTLPGYPLALKSPYLSSWLFYNQSMDVPTATTNFWAGQTLTWQIYARIDGGTTYCVYGCPDSGVENAQQTSISFTSTHTYITLEAGDAEIILDFFSPVSLTDYVRQSVPYSYITVNVSTTADVMVAIDDSWTGLQPNTQVNRFTSDEGAQGFVLSGTDQLIRGEKNDQALWGEVVLTARCGSGGKISRETGMSGELTGQFSKTGCLSDSNTTYTSGDLAAVAYSNEGSGSTSATFAIGLEQEEAFLWLNATQTGYYRACLDGRSAVVDYFFDDAAAAWEESMLLDQQVREIGYSVSANYSDVLESTVRQIWAAFQILIPSDSKDKSKAKAWMKEISTDGNVQTLADLLPKAWPVFYILAPDYMRLHLEPIMEYSLTWPADFAFHDLGKHYPNATGETVAAQEALIIDQTSVIHWMAYAYQRASGDTEWVKPYIPTLQKFADYLVNNGLYVAKQKSAVDSIGPTANQTVLAMYAAIGLTSFGALSGQDNYTAVGKSFVPVILDLGTGSEHTHITSNYGDNDTSWITTYPLAFDKMLGLDTFNASVYDMQSKFYETKLSTYGMPFFNGVNYTVGALQAWAAATSSDYVRDSLVNGIHAYLTDGFNSEPGPTRWYIIGDGPGKMPGDWLFSRDKPTCGSYFMVAAVNQKVPVEQKMMVLQRSGSGDYPRGG